MLRAAFLASLLLFAQATAAFAPPVEATGFNKLQLARLADRMRSFAEKEEIAGSVVLVARQGKVGFLSASGFQNVETKTPMRTDSIFQIMSMTKPFTGVAVMMLVEEGKIALNDPVERYLPEFRNQQVAEKQGDNVRSLRKPARPITIRDLMTHTSGMSGPHGALANLYQKLDKTLAEVMPAFAREPLDFDPGTRWQYSNPGIAALGRIVEVVSETTYEDFIQSRLLRPLEMRDTFFFAPQEKKSRIALVYERKDGVLRRAPGTILGGDSSQFRPGAKYSAPEFGLYSTASDLFAFYQMMLDGGQRHGRRYLSKASVDVMTSPQTGDLKAGHLPGTAFGLTWEIVRDPIGTMTLLTPATFGHGGAFGTHGWVDRSRNLVGVFLIQQASAYDTYKNAVFQMTAAAVE